MTTPTELSAHLAWRYATKKFDPSKKISPEIWQALRQSLVQTPSSFGLQPWKFLIIDTPALRAQLRAVSWNQGQVEDAAHHVVFLARTEMTEADIDRLLDQQVAVRGTPRESLAGYRAMMVKSIVGASPEVIREWAARQVYLALGQFMLACASQKVDACPMEGLDPVKYDQILGLAGSGYRTVVACPVGYRAADDRYAELAKIRFPEADLIEVR
jgi:nitroreductase